MLAAAAQRPNVSSKTADVRVCQVDYYHSPNTAFIDSGAPLPLGTSAEVALIKNALTGMLADKHTEIVTEWKQAGKKLLTTVWLDCPLSCTPGASADGEVPSSRPLIDEKKLDIVLRTIENSVQVKLFKPEYRLCFSKPKSYAGAFL